MNKLGLSDKTKKILALLLMGYFTIFSPAVVLAQVTQPASAPITIPVEIPVSNAPEMVYPQNGQTIDLEGAYMFKVKPVAGARGYLFGLFQNGVMVYENWRDNNQLSPNGEFAVHQSNPFHTKFKAGAVKIMIRASINNQWTDAREITITLKPRPVSTPTPMPTIRPSIKPTPQPTVIPSIMPTPRPTATASASPMPTPTPKPVTAKINTIWPFQIRLGGLFIIFGQGFGNAGYPYSSLYFYNPNSRWDVARVTYYQYWSNSIIIGRIPNYLKGNQVYGIKVSPANGQDSAFIYRYISK